MALLKELILEFNKVSTSILDKKSSISIINRLFLKV